MATNIKVTFVVYLISYTLKCLVSVAYSVFKNTLRVMMLFFPKNKNKKQGRGF